jgi:hypothetical protein
MSFMDDWPLRTVCLFEPEMISTVGEGGAGAFLTTAGLGWGLAGPTPWRI